MGESAPPFATRPHRVVRLKSLSVTGAFSCRCWTTAVPLFNPADINRRDDDIVDGRVAPALVAIREEIDIDVALAHWAR